MVKFDAIRRRDIPEVAALHVNGISTGFISSLGVDFVESLYEAIGRSTSSFGFVAEENGKVLGFVAFSSNLNKLYKSIILTKGLSFAVRLAGRMLSVRTIRKALETLFYPVSTRTENLPAAELLSIVIAEEARRKGLAVDLMRKGFAECVKRRISKVKVLVAADNRPANKLYLKCGFHLAGQIDSHGIRSNIYVAETHAAIDTDKGSGGR
ncbi:MAG TPA: GNAT family N-acetyltransferase [Sedimentisphaerales bacterium]|nr:GNAT family N-acetyltransferase [Sedimentisphaerales bacterium]